MHRHKNLYHYRMSSTKMMSVTNKFTGTKALHREGYLEIRVLVHRDLHSVGSSAYEDKCFPRIKHKINGIRCDSYDPLRN